MTEYIDISDIYELIAECVKTTIYGYSVCNYVCLAHGEKAKEILNQASMRKLSESDAMKLSDLIQGQAIMYPMANESATDPISRHLRYLEKEKDKASKLPKKLRNG